MTTSAFVIQIVINGLVLSLSYILVALGLSLIFGIMDIVNFAHGEFYMFGGLTAYYVFSQAGLNYFLTVVVAIFVAALLGFIAEKLVFYPVRRDALAGLIVAMGLVYVFQNSVYLGFGPDPRPVLTPFSGAFHVFGASIPHSKLLPSAGCLILAASLILFMRYTKQGGMLRAVAQDTEAASLQGISMPWARSLALIIGCGLAGAAGALVAPIGFVDPYMGADPLSKAFCVVIIGGLGSIPGACVGGLFIGFVDSVSTTFVGAAASNLFGFIVVFCLLVIRPGGLFGHAH